MCKEGIGWDFPLLGNGNESGNNIAAITMFKGMGIMDGLAREICQNSLDARDKDTESSIPVRVKFELIFLDRENFSLFEEYTEIIEESIKYWDKHPLKTPEIMDFLNSVKKESQKSKIPVLVISDYNTTGLNGVNASEYEQSYWDLLVNTEGISIKQDDNSAGSYGIGKNAPFAYSGLNLVFYNTYAKDGGRAFEGVSRLVTTQKLVNHEKRKTQPIGKYLYIKDMYSGRPILPEDKCSLASQEIFNRTHTGTDVAVVGFKTEDFQNWEHLLATAIIKNFVIAIKEGLLEVIIKSNNAEYTISKEKLYSLLFENFKTDDSLKYTRQIYSTLEEPDYQEDVTIADSCNQKDLAIYIKYDDSYYQSMSRFRNGMLINTTQESLPHYSVVIKTKDIGDGEYTLSKVLRKSEPPQHTEWKAKNITDNRTLHNLAAKYLRKIRTEIQRMLDNLEQAEIKEITDSGLSQIPNIAGKLSNEINNDLLKTEVTLDTENFIPSSSHSNNQYVSATSGEGITNKTYAHKDGEPQNKKKKKRKKKGIVVVTPVHGQDVDPEKIRDGVIKGSGELKIKNISFEKHRTFAIGGNKYRIIVDSPEDYNNVFMKYYAGREDEGRDSLIIKNIKFENEQLKNINKNISGPFNFKKGKNTMHIEFESNELMALIPEYSVEVK